MQYVPLWARHKLVLAGLALLAGGAILLVSNWPSRITAAQSQPAFVEAAPSDGFEVLLDQPAADEAPAATPIGVVVVYVSGAVQAPDVYALPADARVKDLIVAAGGFADNADAERINLADRLSDAQHVQVPRQGDQAALAAADPDDAGEAASGPALINLNTASAAELDELPGIGQAIAQRILDYRSANGPFAAVEDLQNVKGIGASLYVRIAALVTVEP